MGPGGKDFFFFFFHFFFLPFFLSFLVPGCGGKRRKVRGLGGGRNFDPVHIFLTLYVLYNFFVP